VKRLLLLFSYLAVTAACSTVASGTADQAAFVPTEDVVPAAIPLYRLAETTHPVPTVTSTPTYPATSTPEPYYLEATVWTSEPQVPILVYHRFLPDHYEYSTKV